MRFALTIATVTFVAFFVTSTLGLFTPGGGGVDVLTLAADFSEYLGVPSGSAFDIGEGRSIGSALDSNLFSYNGENF